MIIRPAKFDDARRITEIHVETWKEAYKNQIPQDFLNRMNISDKRIHVWEDIINNSKDITLLSLDNNIITGFCSFGENRDGDLDNDIAELKAIYVHPGYWYMGYGKALCQSCFDDCIAQEKTAISLWVLSTNNMTIQFYKSVGLIPDGKTKTDNRRGVSLHEIRMIKHF